MYKLGLTPLIGDRHDTVQYLLCYYVWNHENPETPQVYILSYIVVKVCGVEEIWRADLLLVMQEEMQTVKIDRFHPSYVLLPHEIMKSLILHKSMIFYHT